MLSNRRIQTAKIGYIVISVLLCALGFLLVLVPGVSAELLCRIGGVLLILFGIVKIVGYFSKDLYRLAFQYDLAFGILSIALGILFIIRSNVVVHVVCIIAGICVLSDALLKIQISMDARKFGILQWWMILTVAIAAGLLGFLLVFRPSQSAQIIMVLLGISLLAEGILNLITILTVVKIVRHQIPDVIEESYREI